MIIAMSVLDISSIIVLVVMYENNSSSTSAGASESGRIVVGSIIAVS